MIKNMIAISLFAVSYQGLAASTMDTTIRTVESFEKVFGITEGKRRNHTKGFCFAGTLSPVDQTIMRFSNSPLFTAESKVTGRLSHKGGNYNAADDKPGEYGMGLSITSKSGEIHLMSMNTLDFSPVATPEAFAELMQAKAKGKDAVKVFKKENVELQRFKAHMSKKKKSLTPYEAKTFNSINSFYLVNENGEKSAVRWSFVPNSQQNIVTGKNQDFLFENMQRNIATHSVEWNLVFTFANENDAIDNASIPWTGKHEKLTAAKLIVSSISSEQLGGCDNINFDPLVLSSGFEASADPLLQARRQAYAISFGKRISEKK